MDDGAPWRDDRGMDIAELRREAAKIKIAAYGRALGPVPEGTPCEHCGAWDECFREKAGRIGRVPPHEVPWAAAPPVTEGVLLHSSRTAYHWDGEGEDPNRHRALCPACAEEHHASWDDMWSNVEGYGR